MSVILTAGATRNPVDAVRHLSAASSGATGVAIARALRDRGVAPWVLGSPEARLRGPELPGEVYGSTRDLMARVERCVRASPRAALVHACAVGDYELADATAAKIPSGRDRLVLELVPTPKIADRVRGWGLTGPYVTFKAASPETTDDDLVRIALAQRARTGSDLVFANVLGRIDTGVWLIGDEQRRFERRADGLAALVDAIVARLI